MKRLKVRYQRDIKSNYLVIETEIGSQVVDYQVPMLINNDIRGLLKLTVENIDDKLELLYDISSKQKLSNILERQTLSYENLKKILYSFIEIIEVITEYLLDGNGIILEAEYIYINPETFQIFFCYNPFYKGNLLRDLHQLFAKFIEKVNYEDKEAVELIYKIYQCSKKEEFQINDFINVINSNKQIERIQDEEEEMEEKDESHISLVKPQVFSQQIDVEKEILACTFQGKIIIFLISLLSIVIGIIASFYIIKTSFTNLLIIIKISALLIGEICIVFLLIMKTLNTFRNSKIITEKEILSYEEEGDLYQSSSSLIEEEYVAEEREVYGDTLLLAYSKRNDKRRLVPIYNNEMPEIFMDHFPYIIGRIKGQSDEVINHPLISRLHLSIEAENEKYYIVDLNSTNGVRINGDLLESNEKREIFVSDEVGIADIIYVFQ